MVVLVVDDDDVDSSRGKDGKRSKTKHAQVGKLSMCWARQQPRQCAHVVQVVEQASSNSKSFLILCRRNLPTGRSTYLYPASLSLNF